MGSAEVVDEDSDNGKDAADGFKGNFLGLVPRALQVLPPAHPHPTPSYSIKFPPRVRYLTMNFGKKLLYQELLFPSVTAAAVIK